MNFSKVVYQLVIGFLVFSFVAAFFGVVTLPDDPFYLLAAYFAFSLAILLHENILTFLTVKKVFLTRMITVAILTSFVLIFFELTVPGFKIGPYTIDPQRLEFITIESYEVSKYVTIALMGALSGFIIALLHWLDKSGKQA
jgi:hypothetical protein